MDICALEDAARWRRNRRWEMYVQAVHVHAVVSHSTERLSVRDLLDMLPGYEPEFELVPMEPGE